MRKYTFHLSFGRMAASLHPKSPAIVLTICGGFGLYASHRQACFRALPKQLRNGNRKTS